MAFLKEFFEKVNFEKKSADNKKKKHANSMQITFAYSFNPDQDQQNVGPDLCPNCLQRSSVDDKSQRYRARKELNME